MGIENYVPVVLRLKQFREDNKSKEVLVKTEATVNFEKEAAFFKTTISVDGKEVATGHALAPALGEDKEFEKAETSSIGRALANLGYAAEDEDADSSSSKKSSSKKSSKGGLGLGAKKASKKVEEDEEEEETEEESEDEDESEEESDEEESEDEEESDDEEEEEAPKKKPAGKAKLSGVMAKYGLK
jgi:translation initiation factor 5B